MRTKIIIAFFCAMVTSSTSLSMNGWNKTIHVHSVVSQDNGSGASIFEAYDKTKSMKQRFERLDGLGLYLKENPSFRAYIISFGGRRSCWREGLIRARSARDYLSKVKGIDRKRIAALDGGYLDHWAVYLWVGGTGDSPPAPLPTVSRSDVRIVRNCNLRSGGVRSGDPSLRK